MNQHIKSIQVSRSVSSSDCEIKPRNIVLDWSEVPLNWIYNDRFSSNAMNALSYFLVDAEFSMCRLCHESLPYIKDEKLIDDLKNFAKQEALHARAHEKHKKDFMQRYGIDNIPINKPVRILMERILSNKPFGYELSGKSKKAWLMCRAGVFAAAEHYTTGLAHFMFNSTEWELNGCDPVMSNLLHWHAAEEIEHRTVMFDLYQALGGRLSVRRFFMMGFVPTFVALIGISTAQINELDQESAKNQRKIWQLGLWKAWRRGAILKNIPDVEWFVKHSFSFMSQYYNPVNEGSTEQALEYLKLMQNVIELGHGKKPAFH
ncbi:metal-dependent hydrolase [Acinetobacter ursingii]|uniref:Metal-dependent hydrolase n=1 Tax=Acinetobacter ursingii TaxID=108980 RepID=A0AA46S3X4_9GAMM|nr:metal-dependent hydrolase [Acinetobacter ursingii]UYF70843.1 metal-dependent hydrolase [Acinetobacter ursingii]